jgi:hypothetical protein
VCSLCGVLGQPHWAEEGSSRRARIERVRLVNRVLGHFGLKLDDWSSAVYVVRDRKGRAEVVADLGSLWPAAERLAGRPLDPLDPDVVAAIRGG